MALSEILTPCYLKQVFLQQVRDTDKNGVPLPDAFYQAFIDGAISQLEFNLDIDLTGSSVEPHTQRIDTFDFFADTWFLSNLKKRPIASIVSFGLQYGNFPVADVGLGWFFLRDHVHGIFQTTVGPGAFTLPAFPFPFLGFRTGAQYNPGWINVKYISGFVRPLNALFSTTQGSPVVAVGIKPPATEVMIANDIKAGHWIKIGTDPKLYQVGAATSQQITLREPSRTTQTSVTALAYAYDPIMVNVAAWLAAIPILETIANYIYGGPGIAGKSLSADSFSQSKPYAVSPGKSVYAAMEDRYKQLADNAIADLRRHYDRVQVFAIGG